MKKIDRLRKRSDFLCVQRQGRKWIAKGLIVEVRANENLKIRYGLTVSKKVSKLAVARNLLKRRLRAIAYDVLPAYQNQNLDIVLIGRFGGQTRSYDELSNDVRWCLKKMDILPD